MSEKEDAIPPSEIAAMDDSTNQPVKDDHHNEINNYQAGEDEPMGNDDKGGHGEAGGGGNLVVRPIFLGNLNHGCLTSEVEAMFSSPVLSIASSDGGDPKREMPVDRVDMKRGYGFVFLKDAVTPADKERIERYVSEINGMNVERVSRALRAEFARGDGRIKRKEDERRKKISPSETLFVVNFHEETTKREDLQMLFEPFGELVRIDMKRNYAFVQFRTIDEAQRAKEATNGGKLDQSEITVEFVARRMGEADRRRDDRRDSRFRGDRVAPRYGDRGRGRDNRDRDGRDDRGGRYGGDKNFTPRDRSPGRRDYRRRSRSRSRSPGYRASYDRRRSRSPTDHRSRPSSSSYDRRRSRSPEGRGRDYDDRGRDHEDRGRDDYRADRGYRSERGYGDEGR